MNICIALPDTGPPATPTSTHSSSASPQPTKNAAAMIGFQPWQLLVVPFAAFGGLALLCWDGQYGSLARGGIWLRSYLNTRHLYLNIYQAICRKTRLVIGSRNCGSWDFAIGGAPCHVIYLTDSVTAKTPVQSGITMHNDGPFCSAHKIQDADLDRWRWDKA